MADSAKKQPLGAPLLAPEEKSRDTFGQTCFVKFYGFDRLWVAAFAASAFLTPAARLMDEHLEGEHRRYDNMVWSDLWLCMLGLSLILGVTWSVDCPPFARLHSAHGKQPPECWAHLIKALAIVNCVRPALPMLTRDTSWSTASHSGGIFQVSAGVFAVPFGIGVHDMTLAAARSIIDEIEKSHEDGKWVRVMRKLQEFRANMLQLWWLNNAGLPWVVAVAGGAYGAYWNGVACLEGQPQRAMFFFVFVGLVLVVLYPLSMVTTECTVRLSSAATKWYPPSEFTAEGRGALREDHYQAYMLVLRFLDTKFLGVTLLGIPITEGFLRDLGLKALLGLPSIYGAIQAVTRGHRRST